MVPGSPSIRKSPWCRRSRGHPTTPAFSVRRASTSRGQALSAPARAARKAKSAAIHAYFERTPLAESAQCPRIQSSQHVRNRWRQLRAFLSGRIRYRITRAGLLFTLAISIVAFAAVVSANNLLFLILATMMATLLISGLVSRLCLAGLELDFQVPDHIPANRSVPARLYVRNHKWLMPSFSIRVDPVRAAGLETSVYFPLVPAASTLEEAVSVRFPRRGAYRENGFAFSTCFPFGFLEKVARVTLRREVIVYPPIDPQPGFDDLLEGIAGEIESHYRGLGRDLYRIRTAEIFEGPRH